jgi:hypothetical protein
MARANPFDASDVLTTTEYVVHTTGDRWFIPVNSDDSMADQLAECQKLSPNGSEVVAA